MKLTPLDVQQKRFQAGFRGYDKEEVESFLEMVSNEMEEAMHENKRLQEELGTKDKMIVEYQQRERSINESIITAQKVTDEMKENAERQAGLITSEAEIQAEKIVQNAQQELGNAEKKAGLITSEAEIRAEKIVHNANQELGNIKREILNLKRQRLEFVAKLRSIIEAHQKLLEMDGFEEHPEQEISMDLDED